MMESGWPAADRRTEAYLQGGLRNILLELAWEIGTADSHEYLERYTFRFDGLTPWPGLDVDGCLYRPTGCVSITVVDSMAGASYEDRLRADRQLWGPEVQFRGEW